MADKHDGNDASFKFSVSHCANMVRLVLIALAISGAFVVSEGAEVIHVTVSLHLASSV